MSCNELPCPVLMDPVGRHAEGILGGILCPGLAEWSGWRVDLGNEVVVRYLLSSRARWCVEVVCRNSESRWLVEMWVEMLSRDVR